MSAVAAVPVPARVAEIQARLAPATTVSRRDSATFQSALLDAQLRSDAYAGGGLTTPTGVDPATLRSLGLNRSALGSSVGGSTGNDVIAEAMKYLGVPYVWGGNDPATGVDCSGFTRHVFGQFGVELPRVSRDQARTGTPVASLADARPGDLLAFGSPVDHVAIYLGNNRMVHAAGTGKGVRVDDVYRQPTAIRRVLPANSFAAGELIGRNGATSAHQNVQGVGSEAAYAALFNAAGAAHGIDPTLLSAVARAESGYNPNAVSRSGALGLMQFMPGTASGLGIDPLDPAQAVDGAARYLAQQLERFGSVELALAAYNAGPGAVSRFGGVPPYPETQNYVTKVLGFHAEAQARTGATT
jgi:cell wall-associated NlpC family hydrolase